MADLRCRTCGKANPDTHEECEFCGARLQPPALLQANDPPPGGSRQGRTGQLEEDVSPNWLARLREHAAKEQDVESLEEEEAEEEGPDPDWLHRLRQYDDKQPAAGAGTATGSAPDGEPDWVSRVRSRAAGEDASARTAGLSTTSGIGPLRGTTGESEEGSQASEEEGDWLSRLHSRMEQEQSGSGPEPAPPLAPEGRHRIESLLEGKSGPLSEPPTVAPDWLAYVRKKETSPSVQPEPEPFSELPDRLGTVLPAGIDIITETATATAATPTSPIQGPATPRPQLPIPPLDEAGEMLPAGTPDWLAAMHPQDYGASEGADWTLADDHVEWSGPLAGMRGILRAEPVIALPQKPAVLRTRLEVSDVQAARAELLRGLLEEEVRQTPARTRTRIRWPMEQWLISLALLLAVLAPIMLETARLPRPETIAPEALAVSELIKQLPPSAPVLVAFEYDPASTGELDLAGGAVVDHLMVRGARLVTLSTRPAGAGLALRLVDPLAAAHNYVYGENYVHLGFVAGEGTGLSALAANPQGILPADFAGNPAWGQPALAGIQSLADFALVVVVSVTPDGVRQWLEQAKPQAGAAPFVAVISAGAEPLVRPYTESNTPQLAGLVSGFSGAGGYEQLTGRTGGSLARWDAYGFGMLAASTILLLGLVLYGAASALRRNGGSRAS